MYWILLLIIAMALVGFALYFFFVRDKGNIYERAMRLAADGSYTDARANVRSRIDRDPDNMRAHYYMSRIYALEGDHKNELHHLQEMKRIRQPLSEMSHIQVLNRIGEIHYDMADYRSSYENYLESYNTNPRNEEALTHLAFMAIGRSEFEIAEKYFRELVALAPSVSEYRIARGVGLAMMRKGEAIQELEKGLASNPADLTARFLTAFQAFRQGEPQRSIGLLEQIIPDLKDEGVLYLAHRIATTVYYQTRMYSRALESAEECLDIALRLEWKSEQYDSRLAVAYMAIFTGDLEKANDHLLELEIQNPTDDVVMKVADFRMDLEEGITTIDQVSPRGFDFKMHLKDWSSRRFPDDTIYRISGLRMEDDFDIVSFYTKETARKPVQQAQVIDYDSIIEKFNSLSTAKFAEVCEKIIISQGYKVENNIPTRDRDGLDFIAQDRNDKKKRALFRIRKWKNQPISDIFLRDMQNMLNELKVTNGFVVAGARLTPGAEAALQNLKKISVINDQDLGQLLTQVL